MGRDSLTVDAYEDMKGQRIRSAPAISSVAVAAVSAAAVLVPALSWAQTPAEPDRYLYGPHMMWGGGWYSMIFGPLFMILVLVAVIAGFGLVGRWFGTPWYGAQPPHHAPPAQTPLDILRERFARGEIDKDEFEERRRLLSE
jgi:putative membrane protein